MPEKTISQSALFQHSANTLYRIVNDIEHYPEFIKSCSHSNIIKQSDNSLTGQLTLNVAGINIQITTENKLTPNQQIDMQFVEGSLKSLTGQWQFIAITDNACRVNLELRYQLKNPIHNLGIEKLAKPLAKELIDAIAMRCYDPDKK